MAARMRSRTGRGLSRALGTDIDPKAAFEDRVRRIVLERLRKTRRENDRQRRLRRRAEDLGETFPKRAGPIDRKSVV